MNAADEILYEERQRPSPWAWALLLGPVALAWVYVAVDTEMLSGHPWAPDRRMVAKLIALQCALVVEIATIQVLALGGQRLKVSRGLVLAWVQRIRRLRVHTGEVALYREASYSVGRPFWRSRRRWYPDMRIHSSLGRRGALLEMRNGRLIYLGSREPERLYAALEAAGIPRGPGVVDLP